jgi:DegV family protein with EDD domain
MPGIRLVTDSTCDLPSELIERHNILVVPAILNIEGKSYRDGVDISRSDYYNRLPSMKSLPTTAAPAAGEFEAAYRQCGEADIISIHLASQLSGLFNAARLGAEAFGPRVTLIDSGQVSMGFGWQIIAAAEAIASGKPLAEVLEAITSVRKRIKVLALLDTIEYLRRGGRAGAIAAMLGEWLQIKPLIELSEGQLIPVARLRTRGKAIEKVVELVEAFSPLERLAVLHVQSYKEAHALAERLAARAAHSPLVVEVTTVIGTHVGPGALGIAAVKSA